MPAGKAEDLAKAQAEWAVRARFPVLFSCLPLLFAAERVSNGMQGGGKAIAAGVFTAMNSRTKAKM